MCIRDRLNPALTESLESARSIYWDLGKLNMVQKLLELELKVGADGPNASALLLELGDVLCDQGEWEKATATYARSLGASGGKNAEASACLEDVQVEAETWQAHLAALLRTANQGDAAAKARVLLRASRVARRFAQDEIEGLLARAYQADAAGKQAAALYEGLLAGQGRFDALEQAQSQILRQTEDRKARARLAQNEASPRAPQRRRSRRVTGLLTTRKCDFSRFAWRRRDSRRRGGGTGVAP